MRQPNFLAVASHKGGTGRTTTALALAWLFGAQGPTVLPAPRPRPPENVGSRAVVYH